MGSPLLTHTSLVSFSNNLSSKSYFGKKSVGSENANLAGLFSEQNEFVLFTLLCSCLEPLCKNMFNQTTAPLSESSKKDLSKSRPLFLTRLKTFRRKISVAIN